ncbi:MAG: 16S rRNA (cytosine(1402)-N(4))-methyltransferase RsmH [Deltaproteobacteria bacterium]|nr:16S rRNA (cytosine(1402)-N(4))-methyltransferase RsmH [Deltaproteobacteria bacterium]MCL5792881.1 16S rRNA (cytosine(1402)-N(4))-methyltransferase RsmH [Deltaproteobacteria bacterium]
MSPHNKGVYLDATVGHGGHAKAILEASSPDGFVVCVDIDPSALEAAKTNLKDFEQRIKLVNANYKDIKTIIKQSEFEKFDGILLDLGFNVSQIFDESRGFSFIKDGPLDMRFDRSSDLTAYDVVNRFTQEKLAKIIKEYGEEKYFYKIAKAIVIARQKRPIQNTLTLSAIISNVVKRYTRIHPATRTFQAIRIFVNNELENLKSFVDSVKDIVNIEGTIVIISFHSLEDRIVKNVFKQLLTITGPSFTLLTPKPLTADESELDLNRMARSAKLRAVKRVA